MATQRDLDLADPTHQRKGPSRGDDLNSRAEAILAISEDQRGHAASPGVRAAVRRCCRSHSRGLTGRADVNGEPWLNGLRLPESWAFIAMLGVGGDLP